MKKLIIISFIAVLIGAILGMGSMVLFSEKVDAKITNNGDGTFTMSMTYNTADAIRVRDCFAYEYNYQENITLENGSVVSNSVSKSDFAEDKVEGYISNVVQSCESKQAAEAARLAALEAGGVVFE